MSGKATKTMLRAYFQRAIAINFLSGFFMTPAENFHDTEEVEIDIMRDDEDVATVITDLSTGAKLNNFDGYTNKAFKPPVYNEQAGINAFELLGREPGEDPFRNSSYAAKAIRRAFVHFRKLEAKVRRAVEIQASQVLQTGTLTLTDEKGNSAYVLDYAPKSTHFPTAGTTWGQAGDDKLGNLEALAEVIRTDGKSDPNALIFGTKAFDEFLKDPAVLERLDNRRMNVGEVAPQTRGNGGTFQGFIWLGNYRFEMWTYNGRYKDPATGVSKKYIDTGKVVMMDRMARLDLTFGSIPFIQRNQAVLAGLPARMTSTGNGFGMTTNNWVNDAGTHLNVTAGTRPLCIPTAIDTFGALDTGLTD